MRQIKESDHGFVIRTECQEETAQLRLIPPEELVKLVDFSVAYREFCEAYDYRENEDVAYEEFLKYALIPWMTHLGQTLFIGASSVAGVYRVYQAMRESGMPLGRFKFRVFIEEERAEEALSRFPLQEIQIIAINVDDLQDSEFSEEPWAPLAGIGWGTTFYPQLPG